MKKIFLIVAVLSLVSIAANAQKYGFYGRGAAKTQRTSYHNGVSGTYIGYHPAGVSNSHVTGSAYSQRSGSAIAIPQQNSRKTGMRGSTYFKSDFSLPRYGESKVYVSNRSQYTETSDATKYTPLKRAKIEFQGYTGSFGGGSTDVQYGRKGGSSSGSSRTATISTISVKRAKGYNPLKTSSEWTNSLGFSTSVTDIKNGSFIYSGGINATDVSYGKKSNAKVEKSPAAIASAPVQLASTTNDNNDTEGDGTASQGFLEPSAYDSAPLGDAIIPLLLLLIPAVVIKAHID